MCTRILASRTLVQTETYVVWPGIRITSHREDLAELVADLSPRFLRFPGGNFIEGYAPQSAFMWKNTVGPVEQRPGHMGVWGYHYNSFVNTLL